MKDILIFSNSSPPEKIWSEKIKKELSNRNNVHVFSLDNSIKVQDIVSKYLSILNFDEKKIIITTSSVLSFVNDLTNLGYSNIDLCLCVSNTNPKDNTLLFDLNNKCFKTIIFQLMHKNDNYYVSNIPLVPIYGDLENIEKYIDYIKMSLLINNNDTLYKDLSTEDIQSATLIIDENRIKYKYINNWLFDPQNKLLSFSYNSEKYIAKRTTKQKANLEIINAQILNRILDGLEFDNFKIKVVIPSFYEINNKYGYLVSKCYGKDLNQLYYEKDNQKLKNLKKIYLYIKTLLESNYLIYNGFIPRNVILDDNLVYLIDFEDINKKDKTFYETNQGIAWSYFIDLDLYKIANTLNENNSINISSEMQELVSCYSNIYKIALLAESSYNTKRKLDDIINVLSEYLNYEIELILDIMLYEQSMNNISINIEELLYSLVEKIKIIAYYHNYEEIKKIVNLEIKNILLYLQERIESTQLNELINYARVRINK